MIKPSIVQPLIVVRFNSWSMGTGSTIALIVPILFVPHPHQPPPTPLTNVRGAILMTQVACL